MVLAALLVNYLHHPCGHLPCSRAFQSAEPGRSGWSSGRCRGEREWEGGRSAPFPPHAPWRGKGQQRLGTSGPEVGVGTSSALCRKGITQVPQGLAASAGVRAQPCRAMGLPGGGGTVPAAALRAPARLFRATEVHSGDRAGEGNAWLPPTCSSSHLAPSQAAEAQGHSSKSYPIHLQNGPRLPTFLQGHGQMISRPQPLQWPPTLSTSPLPRLVLSKPFCPKQPDD